MIVPSLCHLGRRSFGYIASGSSLLEWLRDELALEYGRYSEVKLR